MADLNIKYEETRSVGNQVTSKGQDFSALLSRIQATNNELKSYWEGSDSSKYSTAVEQQAEYMKELADTIDEIGTFLVEVGNAYEQAMNDNQNAINS